MRTSLPRLPPPPAAAAVVVARVQPHRARVRRQPRNGQCSAHVGAPASMPHTYTHTHTQAHERAQRGGGWGRQHTWQTCGIACIARAPAARSPPTTAARPPAARPPPTVRAPTAHSPRRRLRARAHRTRERERERERLVSHTVKTNPHPWTQTCEKHRHAGAQQATSRLATHCALQP